MLQNSATGQTQDQKGYHSDDPSLSHQNVYKTKFNIDNYPRDLLESPMITTSNSLKTIHSKDVRFNGRPYNHDSSTTDAYCRNLGYEEVPHGAHTEALLQ